MKIEQVVSANLDSILFQDLTFVLICRIAGYLVLNQIPFLVKGNVFVSKDLIIYLVFALFVNLKSFLMEQNAFWLIVRTQIK